MSFQIFQYNDSSELLKLKLPLLSSSVSAGFPSPAQDYIEDTLDLNRYLIKHPAATFFMRVNGDSMIGAGINDKDILVVDRAEVPKNGSVVIAIIDNELTVKRLRTEPDCWYLDAENDYYPSIPIEPESDFVIWGVVIWTIHSTKEEWR
jgi:DNA polymerase V